MAKLEKSFLMLTFFGGILSQWQVCYLKFSIFLYSILPVSREKKILPLRRADFKIYQHKNQKEIENHKIKKNAFSKIVLHIFCRSKSK